MYKKISLNYCLIITNNSTKKLKYLKIILEFEYYRIISERNTYSNEITLKKMLQIICNEISLKLYERECTCWNLSNISKGYNGKKKFEAIYDIWYLYYSQASYLSREYQF